MFSRSTKQFILQHCLDNVKQLALVSRTGLSPDVDIREAIAQIAGRQAIRYKIPSWYDNDNVIYPVSLSLEQCSSELTATYKASLVSGHSLVDLTGGFGVDCAFLSEKFQHSVYVESKPELCSIAKHNFSELGIRHITVEEGKAEDYLDLMPQVDCIYLDPARRANSGQKVVAIADCEPDVVQLNEKLLEKAETVMIKLSPMLDISSALLALPQTYQVHVVSVENECKELLFLLKKGWSGGADIICVNIRKVGNHAPFLFSKDDEKALAVHYTPEVQTYIYEPNASILKAGAYKSVAERYKLSKLHPDSHLYTSDELLPDFPGRAFLTDAVFTFSKNDLKMYLGKLKQANISIRNFPSSVPELRKKLGLKEGGEEYLFATTLGNGKKVLILGHKMKLD